MYRRDERLITGDAADDDLGEGGFEIVAIDDAWDGTGMTFSSMVATIGDEKELDLEG